MAVENHSGVVCHWAAGVFGPDIQADFLLAPIMAWMGLPTSAALVIIVDIFTGIYGTVVALSVMPFSMGHMILLAVFTSICHNLIQESIVQGMSIFSMVIPFGSRRFAFPSISYR